jgi:hypothetical protein
VSRFVITERELLDTVAPLSQVVAHRLELGLGVRELALRTRHGRGGAGVQLARERSG